MAKNDKNPAENPAPEERKPYQTFDDEDDFKDLSLTGEFVYVKPEPGAMIRGKMLGRHRRTGGNSLGSPYYYRIALTRPTLCFKGKKDHVEQFEGQPGLIVNVDERESLKVLMDASLRAEKGEEVEVIIRCLGKDKSSKGMQFWKYDVKYRVSDSPILPF